MVFSFPMICSATTDVSTDTEYELKTEKNKTDPYTDTEFQVKKDGTGADCDCGPSACVISNSIKFEKGEKIRLGFSMYADIDDKVDSEVPADVGIITPSGEYKYISIKGYVRYFFDAEETGFYKIKIRNLSTDKTIKTTTYFVTKDDMTPLMKLVPYAFIFMLIISAFIAYPVLAFDKKIINNFLLKKKNHSLYDYVNFGYQFGPFSTFEWVLVIYNALYPLVIILLVLNSMNNYSYEHANGISPPVPVWAVPALVVGKVVGWVVIVFIFKNRNNDKYYDLY